MTIQDVSTTISDGNLGVVDTEVDSLGVFAGYCSGGTPNVLTTIASKAACDALGDGPLAEVARLTLENSGKKFYVLPLTTSNGTVSSVTQPGGSPPAVGTTGNPRDEYVAKVKMTLGGAVATSKFKYSLDDGESWSDELFTAATYPIPGTGITLTFAAGTYVLNDVYSFTTTAPSYSTTNLNTGLDAALDAEDDFAWVYLVGTATGADDAEKSTTCATMAAALGAKANTGFTAKNKFFRAFIEAPEVGDTALKTAFASFVNDRVTLLAGHGKTLSPRTGRMHVVPCGRAFISRFAKKKIGKDPSQVFAEDGTGAMPSQLLSIKRDESKAQTLDSARISTFRTYRGKKGFFVTNVWLMSQSGSDLRYIQHGQIIDQVCRNGRLKALDYLSRDLEVKLDGTGRLTDGQAGSIDVDLDAAVRPPAAEHVSGLGIFVDRTLDVISTESLKFSVGIVPKGYPKTITQTVGFTKKINKPT